MHQTLTGSTIPAFPYPVDAAQLSHISGEVATIPFDAKYAEASHRDDAFINHARTLAGYLEVQAAKRVLRTDEIDLEGVL